MKPIHTIFLMLLLAACAAPQVTDQHEMSVEGNRLQVASGVIANRGRYIVIQNPDKHWVGSLSGGREKWQDRATLLNSWATQEIRSICGEWFYQVIRPPIYNMMDKDETMGGMAPVLGIGASMLAHLAASSATDDANVPVSLYTEFACQKDDAAKP